MIEKTLPYHLMLTATLKNKKCSLQFLPKKLESISTQKTIEFKDKKLKTSYLIDIVHNLILKYYFKKENSFILNATILKEKYGYLYNFYIEYLVDSKIIQLKKNYQKGKRSRVYSISSDILTEDILRYKNFDKVLMKKYINRYYQFEIDNTEYISKELKNKLINDLYSVKIQYEKSIYFLDHLKDEDLSVYNRNKYSVESINDTHIFYHFDHYGRMHSNFTILKTFIRKNCLLIDGEETFEKDLVNSQPLLLYKLIKDSETKWVKSDELELFRILVRNGNYYQYLIDNLNLEGKKEAKDLTYKVLFGKNHKNSRLDSYFETLFPSIHHFIKLYKKEHGDYKVLAYTLQRMESNLIFNKIIKTIMLIDPSIKMITIHDSIICQSKHRELLTKVFNSMVEEEFNYNQ
jgi:hypothetical protein